jgi:hypothetical protein
MGKYHITWECDPSKIPVSAKERGDGWLILAEMVKEDIKKGIMKDWGAFPGEVNGYFIAECTELEVARMCTQYHPYVFFKIKPVISVSQAEELFKSMAKS